MNHPWQKSDPHSSLKRNIHAPLALGLLAVAIFLCPGAATMLEFSRPQILAGQFWRLFTAHLTHFTAQHLLWDGLAFIVLSIMLAGRSFGSLIACILGAAPVISIAILLFLPDIAIYRGLSGIDSALFATAATLLLQQAHRERRRTLGICAAVAILLLTLKTIFEVRTGRVLFVQNLGPNVFPLALAHVVGAVWGFLIALVPALHRRIFALGPPKSSTRANLIPIH